MDKLTHSRSYPFLFEIVNSNHDYISNFTCDMDFDTYIVLMNLYLYTCKYMNEAKLPLTKESIYNNMKQLFSNPDFRTQLIATFRNQMEMLGNTPLKTIKLLK